MAIFFIRKDLINLFSLAWDRLFFSRSLIPRYLGGKNSFSMSGAHSSYSMSGALSSDRLAGAFSEESIDELDHGPNGEGEPPLSGSEPGSAAADGVRSVPSLEAPSEETVSEGPVSVSEVEAPPGEAASTAVISSEATPCISSSE
jgi:hypothetical protein